VIFQQIAMVGLNRTWKTSWANRKPTMNITRKKEIQGENNPFDVPIA